MRRPILVSTFIGVLVIALDFVDGKALDLSDLQEGLIIVAFGLVGIPLGWRLGGGSVSPRGMRELWRRYRHHSRRISDS
jgi:hypothetical protein